MQQIGCLLIRPFHLQRRKRARWAPCSVPSHPSVPPLGGGGTSISDAVGRGFVTTHFARLTFQGELRCPSERDGWHARMSGAGRRECFFSSFLPLPHSFTRFLTSSERASGQFICGAWAKKVFPLFKSLPRSGRKPASFYVRSSCALPFQRHLSSVPRILEITKVSPCLSY